jgi:predicted RNA-binding Zn-ribbon protein involved in translation (DUF1610 family)
MRLPIRCPSCHRVMHVPEHLAGRKVTCPRCGNPVRVRAQEDSSDEVPASTASGPGGSVEAGERSPPATRLGVGALALGLVSMMVLCLPMVGTMSLGLSGLGLVLGLCGLVCSERQGKKRTGHELAGTLRMPALLGEHVMSFPLAGTIVCFLALGLALLPLLIR